MYRTFDQALQPAAQHTGYYNDPDMLMVGLNGMAAARNRPAHDKRHGCMSISRRAFNRTAQRSAVRGANGARQSGGGAGRGVGRVGRNAPESGLRAMVRRMAEEQAAEQARSDIMDPRRDIAAAVRDQAGPAVTAGIDPSSPQADPIVAAFTAHYAHLLGRPDDVELRRRPATRPESVNGPRRERYLQLRAVFLPRWPRVIRGSPREPSRAPCRARRCVRCARPGKGRTGHAVGTRRRDRWSRLDQGPKGHEFRRTPRVRRGRNASGPLPVTLVRRCGSDRRVPSRARSA